MFEYFLNHLSDDKLGNLNRFQRRLFLNHLSDDKLRINLTTRRPKFLNHLSDDKLELSKNKTPKINYISF